MTLSPQAADVARRAVEFLLAVDELAKTEPAEADRIYRTLANHLRSKHPQALMEAL